jgi:putative peptidoglycan lipid II flippase
MAEAAPGQAAPSRPSGLLVAAAIVAFGFIGSRLLGIVRTAVIADQFGASPDVAAYRVAFLVPDLIFQVLAGATIGSAFIPVFARLYRREGEERAWQLASSALTLITAATAALCVVAFVFAPVLVPLVAPGLDESATPDFDVEGKAVSLTRLMLLSPLLFAVSGMVTGILNARQRFFLPALSPMLYNLAIIVGALVLAEPWGIEGVAAGVVAGAALHLAVQVPGLVRERMHFRLSFEWRDAAVREVGRLMGPRVIGLAAVQLNLFVTVFFASKLGSAQLANVTYAFFIAQLPLALFAMALSTAAFPRLADMVADEDMNSLRDTVSRVLRFIFFLTIPAAIGLALLREPVTRVLLERGEFTSTDTAMAALAVGWYCLAIVPQAGVEIHSRGFYALGDTRTPVILTGVNLAVNAVLSAILWQEFELAGLAFAVGVASWVEWLVLYHLYARRAGANTTEETTYIGAYAFAGGAMAIFLALSWWLLEFDTGARATVGAVALGGAGAAFYFGLSTWLGLPEVREVAERGRALLRRDGSAEDPARTMLEALEE